MDERLQVADGEPPESPTGPRSGRSPERASYRSWLAVWAVTLGIFSLMTSELLPVGLLSPVAAELGVSEGIAGLMVTVPGLVAAVAAPVIAVTAGRIDRRVLLAALLVLLAVGNLGSAVGSDLAVVLAARFVVGVSIGGFWAIAGGLAVRLVPAEQVGRATAVIFGGVSTASVLGVPLGTLLGDTSSWRIAFTALGLLGLVALAGLLLLVPALPGAHELSFGELPRLLRGNVGVRLGVLMTFLLVTGHFIAYTFVRPILREGAGVEAGMVGVVLLAFGVAGVAGNFIAGAWAHHDVRRVVLVISTLLAAVMIMFAFVGQSATAAIALVGLWGLAFGGVSVSLQIWMLKAAPEATEVATSLFVAAFNLSIALGALVGGVVIDGTAVFGVVVCAAVLFVLTACAAGFLRAARMSS
ncbi:MFS transporter [Phytoactinopolyspora sp. XMNu-373]|uniref:MFS transporter n=2 Tax=Phytoactinopolyspora mesophila TaxID=2650750 RepID=A0A7K3M0E3_9ACTN|nr:MFS transporter [Phytoactinopolyspora mesophila]